MNKKYIPLNKIWELKFNCDHYAYGLTPLDGKLL